MRWRGRNRRGCRGGSTCVYKCVPVIAYWLGIDRSCSYSCTMLELVVRAAREGCTEEGDSVCVTTSVWLRIMSVCYVVIIYRSARRSTDE
jgi:hypothetical protein